MQRGKTVGCIMSVQGFGTNLIPRVRGEVGPVVWFVPTKPDMRGKNGTMGVVGIIYID